MSSLNVSGQLARPTYMIYDHNVIDRVRTYTPSVNSRVLYQFSYNDIMDLERFELSVGGLKARWSNLTNR